MNPPGWSTAACVVGGATLGIVAAVLIVWLRGNFGVYITPGSFAGLADAGWDLISMSAGLAVIGGIVGAWFGKTATRREGPN
jgi:hypothetical protein